MKKKNLLVLLGIGAALYMLSQQQQQTILPPPMVGPPAPNPVPVPTTKMSRTPYVSGAPRVVRRGRGFPLTNI